MTKDIVKADLLPTKINGNTGEIIEVRPSVEEVAGKLKVYMESKPKKIFFNGRQYPEFDDWQFIAHAFGLKVRTFDPTFIEINGRKGFKAKASVLDDKQNEVGRAESFCMDDEPNWRSRPLFQLASMAQTRAGAKALSNLFRPVARISGYEGTPAEEFTPDEPREKPKEITPPTTAEIEAAEEVMDDATAERPAPDEISGMGQQGIDQAGRNYKKPYEKREKKPGTISEKQGKLLFAKRKAANIPEATWKAYRKEVLKVEHDDEIPWQMMNDTLKWIERFGNLSE